MQNQATHSEGNITFLTASTINERFVFGALTNGKIAPANGASLRAIAVITDSAGANQHVNAQFLGSNAGTMKVLSAANISAGEYIISNPQGKAISFEDQPTGSYQICGIALSSATPGQCVEFTPTLGLQLTK